MKKITLKSFKREEYERIFGEQFVINNKDKLKMEINGEIRELNEYYYNREIENKILDINLLEIEKVTDISYMFSKCSSLSDISKWDTSNVNNMRAMFYGCISLYKLLNFKLNI